MELTVGSIVEGKVTGITKFGAFVSLPEGKSGLVHISEIAHSYVSDVKDFLTEGQTVKVKIINIDDSNRINLSIKKALPPPPRPEGSAPRGQGRPGGYGRPSGGPRPGGYGRASGGSRPGGPRPSAPKAPPTFEDKLKQFMSESDNRLSESGRFEKRTSRRGGRGRG